MYEIICCIIKMPIEYEYTRYNIKVQSLVEEGKATIYYQCNYICEQLRGRNCSSFDGTYVEQ